MMDIGVPAQPHYGYLCPLPVPGRVSLSPAGLGGLGAPPVSPLRPPRGSQCPLSGHLGGLSVPSQAILGVSVSPLRPPRGSQCPLSGHFRGLSVPSQATSGVSVSPLRPFRESRGLSAPPVSPVRPLQGSQCPLSGHFRGLSVPSQAISGVSVSPLRPPQGSQCPLSGHFRGLSVPSQATSGISVSPLRPPQALSVPSQATSGVSVSPLRPFRGSQCPLSGHLGGLSVPSQATSGVSVSPLRPPRGVSVSPLRPPRGSQCPLSGHLAGPAAPPVSPLCPALRATPVRSGGTLKTLAEADSESLQATWWRGDPRSLPLRSADILPLLELAARYRRSPAHPATLPRELPCSPLCLRLLLPFTNATGDLWVLLATGDTPRLPVVACGTSRSELRAGLLRPLLRLLRERLAWEPQPAALGLLGLQHRPGGSGDTDGICFNVLLSVAPAAGRERPPEPRHPALRWWPVREEAMRERVLQRLRGTVPVRS
uniref:Nudix hydrolase domain-containing protein n=1 Tax=Taeniopygia guttata TaxID=59729 RepID=A0A674GFV4_TAEGU